MKSMTEHWLNLAEYDLETARAMLQSERYLYVTFMCHLTLEKALKGLIAEQQEETSSPDSSAAVLGGTGGCP